MGTAWKDDGIENKYSRTTTEWRLDTVVLGSKLELEHKAETCRLAQRPEHWRRVSHKMSRAMPSYKPQIELSAAVCCSFMHFGIGCSHLN